MKPILPLDTGWVSCVEYDKWGNPLFEDGRRAIGDLFYEEPVQKMLRRANVMSSFTTRVKYPRSMHTPWSPGPSSDDKVVDSMEHFEGAAVVVTEKMDGENCLCPDTYIDTPTGKRKISELSEGDRVWAFDHESGEIVSSEVTGTKAVPSTANDEWFEIETDEGHLIFVTEDHLVWSETRKRYVQVKLLKKGEEVLINDMFCVQEVPEEGK